MKTSTKITFGRFVQLMLLFAALMALSPLTRAQETASGSLDQLQFRTIGPAGNRASAIVGEPGNPMVVYVGAAAGGIFKTTDGGINWRPIFDRQDVAAIGALAVAPSAHNVVLAGTGEPWIIRPFIPMGDGVYKSSDGGTTWTRMGLEQTGRIARIVINPTNPDLVYVCALGQTHKPQRERGIFRSSDGGKTWEHVLFVNENCGCSELSIDAHDSRTLFAGMWEVKVNTWNLQSGGEGSGIYVSHDGGSTWTRLKGGGLPDHPVGKVAVQVAPNDSKRVYALIEDKAPWFLKSDDAGRTWTVTNRSHTILERAGYYTRFAVSPADKDLIYFVSVAWSVWKDGGATPVSGQGFGAPGAEAAPAQAETGADAQRRRASGPQASAGGDNHDIWIDPTNPDRIMVANDGGASISLNGGRSYQRVVLPIAQMYHVAVDDSIPYFVYGNKQDGPTYRGPSNSLGGGGGGGGGGAQPAFVPTQVSAASPGAAATPAPTPAALGGGGGGGFGGSIGVSDWTSVGGCESGFSIPDPVDNTIAYSGCFDGLLARVDLKTGQSRQIAPWPDGAYGWAPADVKYRWNWSSPLIISPHDHNRIYYGSQYVHESTNGGQSWRVISPDLTTNDKSHQRDSGGVAIDNPPGTYDGSLLFSIAESPLQKGLIWTGSNDGQVNVTRDGGKNWTRVTKNIPNLPPWGTVWNIEPSHFDAGTAYLTVNLQQVGNYDAYVYKTSDYGQTWRFISAGVPKSMNSSAHCVIEDPVRRGMLFLGTDNALYVSWDDGGHWTRLRNNLPPAPVYWLTIQRRYNDLVIGTYGRGFWILDDITPLRELDKVGSAEAYLFKPRPAYRYRRTEMARQRDANSNIVGQNPPPGADINFALKSPTRVEVSITGTDGQLIRTLRVNGRAGLNRVWWDLRYELPETVRLRTSPPDEPWIKLGPDGTRAFASYGSFRGNALAGPGAYTVKLRVNGNESTQTLEVLRDPLSLGTEQDIRKQTDFMLQLRQLMGDLAGMINRLEWIRRQLQDAQQSLAKDAKAAAVVKSAQQLEQQALAAEKIINDVNLAGRSEDSFRAPMQLYDKVCYLGSMLNGNWGGNSADLPPTDQEVQLFQQYQKQLAEYRPVYQKVVESGVLAYNEAVKAAGIGQAISVDPAGSSANGSQRRAP